MDEAFGFSEIGSGIIEEYKKRGYPETINADNVSGVAARFEAAEALTRDRYRDQTNANLEKLLGPVVNRFGRIKMAEVPLDEFKSIDTSPPEDRYQNVARLLHQKEDIVKFPPVVMGINNSGKLKLVDGQTRVRRLQDLGAKTVVGYLLPQGWVETIKETT